MSLSKKTKEILTVAMADKKSSAEISAKMDQASHQIIAMSTSATISTDAAFKAALKIGDQVVSHKAAANENGAVIANGTLPVAITDAAGITFAIRAAL